MADTRRALTTKLDHNGTRRRPIPADAPVAQSQVSDCARQSRRILQAGGQGFESPKLHSYQAKHPTSDHDRGARAINVPLACLRQPPGLPIVVIVRAAIGSFP
jgi:hypothetical protein